MSLPDEDLPLIAFVQEEMMDYLSETLSDILSRSTPLARLRLLAFLHLLEDPSAMNASLVVEPSGFLRLTLDTFVASSQPQPH